MAYQDFAAVYDRMMADVDYAGLCDRMLTLLQRRGHTPRLVLDAACGTGSFTKQLADHGLDVIGVDCSEEMLNAARTKLEGRSVLLLCQDLCRLDLYGTVDTVFCTLDGLNHLTDKRALKTALRRIALFLEPGGFFVFDVNTLYKHQHILGNNTFVMEEDGLFAVWQNGSGPAGIVQIDLEIFVAEGERYTRLRESFPERAYSSAEWRTMLQATGFAFLGWYDFDTLGPVRKTGEKMICVARRV